MRRTVIALRLAELVGASQPEREATYYLGLMMNAYCHADAAEQAQWFGDDISFKGDGFDTLGMNTAQMIAFMLRRVGTHGGGVARTKRLAQLSRHRPEADRQLPDHPLHPGSAVRGQDRAGPGGVHRDRSGLRTVGRQGSTAPPARRADLAARAARPVRRAGRGVRPAARARIGAGHGAQARRRRVRPVFGRSVLRAMPPRCWPVWTRLPEWEVIMAAEPRLSRRVDGPELDAVLVAMADLVDLKSPYLAGSLAGSGESGRRGRSGRGTVPGRRRDRAPGGTSPRPGAAGRVQRHLGQARPVDRRRGRARPAAPVPDGSDACPGGTAWRPAGRSLRDTTNGSTVPGTRAG